MDRRHFAALLAATAWPGICVAQASFPSKPIRLVVAFPPGSTGDLVARMVSAKLQDSLGQPSKSNPHNRQWAQKMRDIGLEPSATGLPEGKDTGHSMSHYIRPDGLFLQACRELLTQGFTLQWFDRHAPRTGSCSRASPRCTAPPPSRSPPA